MEREMGALQRADLSGIRDLIAERIKKSFVELMPEDIWKATVEGEIDKFISKGKAGGPSPLAAMIREDINARFATRVKKELDGDEYQGVWSRNEGKDEPGDAVKEMVRELAPELVKAAFSDVAQRAVDQIRQRMEEQGRWS